MDVISLTAFLITQNVGNAQTGSCVKTLQSLTWNQSTRLHEFVAFYGFLTISAAM